MESSSKVLLNIFAIISALVCCHLIVFVVCVSPCGLQSGGEEERRGREARRAYCADWVREIKTSDRHNLGGI